MSEVWVQIIAALSGLVTTLAVKYLEHMLKKRGGTEPSPVWAASTHTDPTQQSSGNPAREEQ